MTCGLLDLACHAEVAVGGLFDWLLGFFDARTLVMLWIGTAIGAQFGWPALIAETFGLLALFGRKSNLPGEDKSDRPEDRPASRRKQSVPKRKTIMDLLRK